MRYPRLVSLSILAFAVALTLNGCGSYQTGSMASSTPATGVAPTVAAVGVQTDGVAPNRKQEVQFSGAMDPSTINSQSFQVADSTGKLATGTVTYDPDFNTASFLPNPALQPGANYTATMTTAAASTDGAHLANPYSYTFTTRSDPDTSPLMVNSVNPAANATCVGANTAITITFDEAPDASTVMPGNFMVSGPSGAIQVKISTSVATTQVVLTPTSPLPSGTVTVTVSNVADLAGVKMAAPYTWSFSTACGGGGGGGANTFVYAGNNTEIAGFEIAADGSASAVSGSPFALGGTGLASSPTGNFLFGDGQTGPGTGMAYYTYSVGANGSLSTASSTTQVPSDPDSGTQPAGLGWITTDRTGTTLYGKVVDASPPNMGYQWVSEYAIGSSGSLSLLGAVGARYDYSPLSVTSNNGYGYFVAVPPMQNPGVVSFLTRNSDGTLTENGVWNFAPPAGAPSGPSTPLYAMASPGSNYLAVLFGFSTGTVGIAVYPINGDGSGGAPTAFLSLTNNGEGAGNWTLAWDSSGTYFFASSMGIIYQARFDSSTNTIALVGATTSATGPAVPADQMSFLNGHLFAVNGQNLYVYNFANGVLTLASGSPVPLGFYAGTVAALQR